MKKQDVEKKVEELEDLIIQAYTNQMFVTGKAISSSDYRRMCILIKDIYWFLDGLEINNENN